MGEARVISYLDISSGAPPPPPPQTERLVRFHLAVVRLEVGWAGLDGASRAQQRDLGGCPARTSRTASRTNSMSCCINTCVREQGERVEGEASVRTGRRVTHACRIYTRGEWDRCMRARGGRGQVAGLAAACTSSVCGTRRRRRLLFSRCVLEGFETLRFLLSRLVVTVQCDICATVAD